MKQLNEIEVFIFALQVQMKKMSDKKSDIYLTLNACKELAESISKESNKPKEN
jgi:hypothetical protein